MSLPEIYERFIDGMLHTSLPEYIAVFTGIASVWFSRIENIWVYPTGLVSTIIYTYLSLDGHLPGEASVNIYYTAMSIYGWILWTKRDAQEHHTVRIKYSDKKVWQQQLLFFGVCYTVLFTVLTWLRQAFSSAIIPWADAFASATAYTGMWLMARKKVESWYWWIATNIASIPLFFIKLYVFTSVYYCVLLFLAVAGLITWSKRAHNTTVSVTE